MGVTFSSEAFGDWAVSRRYCVRARVDKQILQIHFGDCCANIARYEVDTRKENNDTSISLSSKRL